MKLIIKTDTLKEMVTKVIKGAGLEKVMPLTNMLSMTYKDNVFKLQTTDMTNYLVITAKAECDEEFDAVIDDVSQFVKLICKLKCEDTTITVDTDKLIVKGNGTYKFPIVLDPSSTRVEDRLKFPNMFENRKVDETYTIKGSHINALKNIVKPALATTYEVPCHTGYYVGKSVIGTDTYKIADINTELFKDWKTLIPAKVIDMMSVIDDEEITVELTDLGDKDIVVFKGNDFDLFSYSMTEIDNFAIEPISGLVNTNFPYSCVLDKNELLQILDRLALFVGPYDKNSISLKFTNEGIEVTSKSQNGTEKLEYVEKQTVGEFECIIDIMILLTEIRAIEADVFTLQYGLNNAVKIITSTSAGDVTLIVALTVLEQ